jgi:methylenetetrahydrofolate--tRNA-(uracil-5-)-methyltransferase
MAAAEWHGRLVSLPPVETAMGALINHITGGHIVTIDEGPRSFQPMNINFGLFPPIGTALRNETGKRMRGPEKALARKRALTARAKQVMASWMGAATEMAT